MTDQFQSCRELDVKQIKRVSVTVLMFLLLPCCGEAQSGRGYLFRNPYSSPATSISAEIHAEADFIRAYGEAAVDLNVAREVRARAVRLEIDNSVEYVKAYWERRSIHEAERLKRRTTESQRQDIRDSLTWKRLKDHPDLTADAIPNGTALNFLLDRLGGGILAYQFSTDPVARRNHEIGRLEIPTELIHQLHVRQDRSGTERLVFRLDEGQPLDVSWWPAAIRRHELQAEREQFLKARERFLASTQAEFEKTLKELFLAYDQLVDAFHRFHTREVRLKSTQSHREYSLAKRFLQSLAGELYHFRSTGIRYADNQSLRFDGNNFVALLTHMSRNGLEFAPALPGEEAAYHQMFHLMRDLYVAVQEQKGKASPER